MSIIDKIEREHRIEYEFDRDARYNWPNRWDAVVVEVDKLEAHVVELEAEIDIMKISISDPENQPSQFGTILYTDYQSVLALLNKMKELLEHVPSDLAPHDTYYGWCAKRDALLRKVRAVLEGKT